MSRHVHEDRHHRWCFPGPLHCQGIMSMSRIWAHRFLCPYHECVRTGVEKGWILHWCTFLRVHKRARHLHHELIQELPLQGEPWEHHREVAHQGGFHSLWGDCKMRMQPTRIERETSTREERKTREGECLLRMCLPFILEWGTATIEGCITGGIALIGRLLCCSPTWRASIESLMLCVWPEVAAWKGPKGQEVPWERWASHSYCASSYCVTDLHMASRAMSVLK